MGGSGRPRIVSSGCRMPPCPIKPKRLCLPFSFPIPIVFPLGGVALDGRAGTPFSEGFTDKAGRLGPVSLRHILEVKKKEKQLNVSRKRTLCKQGYIRICSASVAAPRRRRGG